MYFFSRLTLIVVLIHERQPFVSFAAFAKKKQNTKEKNGGAKLICAVRTMAAGAMWLLANYLLGKIHGYGKNRIHLWMSNAISRYGDIVRSFRVQSNLIFRCSRSDCQDSLKPSWRSLAQQPHQGVVNPPTERYSSGTKITEFFAPINAKDRYNL